MVVGAIAVFLGSLAGIVGLFSLKLWEERREKTFAPRARTNMDSMALAGKALLLHSEDTLTKLPSVSSYLILRALAAGAVAFAHLVRAAGESAHNLADLVSHKHNFERRETRSDFLKRVSEIPRVQTPATSDVKTAQTDVVPEVVAPIVPARRKKRKISGIDVSH